MCNRVGIEGLVVKKYMSDHIPTKLYDAVIPSQFILFNIYNLIPLNRLTPAKPTQPFAEKFISKNDSRKLSTQCITYTAGLGIFVPCRLTGNLHKHSTHSDNKNIYTFLHC